MRNINAVSSMIEYGMCLIGTPYKWGGANPVSGMDCSGAIQEILSSIGFDPRGDQTAAGLYESFAPRSEHGKLAAGALVFYGSSLDKITHVAMMINDFQVMEAGGGGSKTITRDDAARDSAFFRIRPFNLRTDIVAVLMPTYPV